MCSRAGARTTAASKGVWLAPGGSDTAFEGGVADGVTGLTGEQAITSDAAVTSARIRSGERRGRTTRRYGPSIKGRPPNTCGSLDLASRGTVFRFVVVRVVHP